MNRFFKFLSKNYTPLFASFFLALLLWIAVITDKTYSRIISIPLNINLLEQGYVLSELPPDQVSIEVSGKGRALFGMNFYESTLDLELPELKESTNINLKNYQNRFHIPRNLGIEIVDILEPRTIDLKIDQLAERKIPITIEAFIKPEPGYVLSETILSQSTVLVTGPRTKLNALSTIHSDSIHKKNVTYPFTETLDLLNPDPGIMTLETDKIIAKFDVEQLVERTLYNIPVQLVAIPVDFSALAVPSNVTIHIKGSEKIVSAINVSDVTAIFNYREMYENGKTLYPINIEMPQDVELLEISPSEFRLILKRNEEDI